MTPGKLDIHRLAAPAAFGVGILLLWQAVVVGFAIPRILLPAPTEIGHQLVAQAGMLWADFQQTFLKSVLAGFAMGCGLGFVVAVLIDRVPFLQRGLLPLGNMVSAVPIVGIAPIMVMWFGFGWESKTAVIVFMTFFPMLINTIAGLNAADHMERDLMRSYGASLLADLLHAAAAGGVAVHLQRAEDQFDPGADRRHRGGVLRLADRRHGLPHQRPRSTS